MTLYDAKRKNNSYNILQESIIQEYSISSRHLKQTIPWGSIWSFKYLGVSLIPVSPCEVILRVGLCVKLIDVYSCAIVFFLTAYQAPRECHASQLLGLISVANCMKLLVMHSGCTEQLLFKHTIKLSRQVRHFWTPPSWRGLSSKSYPLRHPSHWGKKNMAKNKL